MPLKDDNESTPHDAIIRALERVDEMQDALVIWTDKKGTIRIAPSTMTLASAVFMVEVFKAWLLREATVEHDD